VNFSDNYFVFIEGTDVYVLNLISGEKKIYNINDYGNEGNYIHNSLLLNNEIYITTGGNSLYIIDLLTDKVITSTEPIDPSKIGQVPINAIGLLFTDGSQLYSILSNTSVWTGENIRLSRITIDGYSLSMKEVGK
jgi:hypothetical protein